MSTCSWVRNNKFNWKVGKKFVRRDKTIVTVDSLRHTESGEIEAVFFEETIDTVYLYGFVAHHDYGPPEADEDIICEYVEPKEKASKFNWEVGKKFVRRNGDIVTVDMIFRNECGSVNSIYFEEDAYGVHPDGFLGHNDDYPVQSKIDIISEYVEPKKEDDKLKWIVGMWYQDREGTKYQLVDIEHRRDIELILLFKNLTDGTATYRNIDGFFGSFRPHPIDIISYADMSVPINHEDNEIKKITPDDLPIGRTFEERYARRAELDLFSKRWYR